MKTLKIDQQELEELRRAGAKVVNVTPRKAPEPVEAPKPGMSEFTQAIVNAIERVSPPVQRPVPWEFVIVRDQNTGLIRSIKAIPVL